MRLGHPEVSGRGWVIIGPSAAVQSVRCIRVTQWPLNSLIFSPLSELITQHVVVVVNLPSQAASKCGQLYTNVYRHSHQIWPVKGLGLRVSHRKWECLPHSDCMAICPHTASVGKSKWGSTLLTPVQHLINTKQSLTFAFNEWLDYTYYSLRFYRYQTKFSI